MSFEAIRATADMAEQLADVHVRAWQATYRGVFPDEYLDNLTLEKRTKTFRRVVTASPEEFYLFRVDGQPAGMAILSPSREPGAERCHGELSAIYLLPEFCGRGVGRQAMAFCLERFRQRGYTRLYLWVLESNQRARRFCEKTGFVMDGARKEIQVGKAFPQMRYVMEM